MWNIFRQKAIREMNNRETVCSFSGFISLLGFRPFLLAVREFCQIRAIQTVAVIKGHNKKAIIIKIDCIDTVLF